MTFSNIKDLEYSSGVTTQMLNNKEHGGHLKFCTGVNKLDFYPFTEIDNWKNLGYWLLVLKPYIDKDKNGDGILDSYIFCQQTNSLEATVCLKATWQDGTPISSFEAAMGIAKGLAHRKNSTALQVKGTEEITKLGWEKKAYSGIEIISPIKFKLHFTGTIENMAGVLEDILSFTTLRNIIWPVRLNSFANPNYDPSYFDIVSKYPIKFQNGKYYLNVLGNTVELATLTSKANYDFYFNTADFNLLKSPAESEKDFILNKRQNMNTVVALFNSLSKNFRDLQTRSKISAILRNIAIRLSTQENLQITDGHFDISEPGYTSEICWSSKNEIFPSEINEIKILLPFLSAKNKILQTFELEAEKNGIKVTWLDSSVLGENTTDFDLQIVVARIQNNRQIWLQNIANSNNFLQCLEKFPATAKALIKINLTSASTIPIKAELLAQFEAAAFLEASFVPLFRYHLYTYSRKDLPIVLNISEFKEFYFSLQR